MNKVVKMILSLPKTVWVNFRYLPVRQAVKLPLLVAYNANFEAHRGGNSAGRSEVWNGAYRVLQYSGM